MLILVAVLTVIFGGVFGAIAFKNVMIAKFMSAYVPPPVSVQVSLVTQEDWEQSLHAVGTLNAVNGVDVSAEVGGIVQTILFTAGQDVEQGQALLQLEDSVEQATLRSLEAQLRLSEINLERDKKLLRSKSISLTDFDKNEAQHDDVFAQVERTRAIIRQKLIRAPFKGRLGIQDINLGQYISQGEMLVTLQSLDTLYVDFTVPERHLPKLAPGQLVRCTVDAYPATVFDGEISAVNVKVDNNTHSVRLRAVLANQAAQLLPGMFVGVSVVVGQPLELTTVPLTAITYSLYGDSVYVVKAQTAGEAKLTGEPLGQNDQQEQLQVERQYVKTGLERDNEVAIIEGLEVGSRVVTAGQLKLRNGATIVIDKSASL
jgi:membrane fusion protein (multidrug efflux system)